MTAAIIGWAHLPFGKFDTETVESLIVKAADAALVHAGLDASDIDEIVLGHFNAGFSPQDFTAALVLQANPAFRFKPATRVENACATGSAAVHQGIRAIAAGATVSRAAIAAAGAAAVGAAIAGAPVEVAPGRLACVIRIRVFIGGLFEPVGQKFQVKIKRRVTHG